MWLARQVGHDPPVIIPFDEEQAAIKRTRNPDAPHLTGTLLLHPTSKHEWIKK
ncbi:hypothetical protein MXD61_19530 [Frankia sp. AgPm24]|uniref:hypothetical protein n=1 Tax=Frankia sp. AgPm24 TaxID=631128 RepID=UPI00200F123C|nr:hypothetical protein [Frankia sp. AgPm24]MCK9924030.1 hypothetical protein [Frankia sp. AgPm24]